MKKIICILLLAAMLFACKPAEQAEKEEFVLSESQIKFKLSNESKEKVEAMQQAKEEIEIEEVEPTMEALVPGPEDWCKTGEQWKFSTEQEDMDASAQWEIQGIVDSGEYAGLCHVLYSAQTPIGETTMDYYFAEDGESGYVEMKLPDGKTMKQEWHG